MKMPEFISKNPAQALMDKFHQDLQSWIGRVWRIRDRILMEAKTSEDDACWTIYGLYGQAGGAAPFDQGEMDRFQTGFLKIMVRCNYSLYAHANPSPAGTFSLQGNIPWTAFYHVQKQLCDYGSIKRRIYVHTTSPSNGLMVMAVIVSMLGTCDGLEKVKIAGPGEKDRLDTIVVYLQDKQTAVDAVLLALQNPRLAPCFKAGLPSGVKEVATGVGVADEPPAIGVIRKGEEDEQSFGWFYSGILLLALRESGGSSLSFIENLLSLFRLAQVDPKNPSSLSDARKLEKLKFVRK